MRTYNTAPDLTEDDAREIHWALGSARAYNYRKLEAVPKDGEHTVMENIFRDRIETITDLMTKMIRYSRRRQRR